MFTLHSISIVVFLVTVFCSQGVNSAGENQTTVISQYNDREIVALSKFRMVLTENNLSLHDYQLEDNYLIRWLRARNLDEHLAYRMLATAQRWRHHNGIENILNETVVQFTPLPYKIGSSDNEGNPLIMFTPTSLDLRRLLINGKNISRYWDQIMEEATLRVREVRNETGKPINHVISLMDLHGFNLRQHGCLACFAVYIDWITDYENYFPQLAKHIVWINAPRVFVAVLELVKPLMSPATSKALRVFGTNRQEWSTYLHKIIPKENLTFRFGGPKKV